MPTPLSEKPSPSLTEQLAECGWREEFITEPDGSTRCIQVPLTEAEFLHPQEGYHLPNSTFHDQVASDARDMLARRYNSSLDVDVFRDLLIKWDIDLGNHCPDVFVVFGLQNKGQNRDTFKVATEGVRPTLIIEVVSPRYRKEDREIKVLQYAQAGVQEYIIIDRRKYRGQFMDEVIGYRLVQPNAYQPISPDDEGRIRCNTVGLWISLRDGQLVLEDSQTGLRLLTSQELEQQATQEQRRADREQQRADQEQQRADQERQRAERLAAFLRSQGFDPDQV
jgi:Uma2 family endonuclease